jgi:hypothetical protein
VEITRRGKRAGRRSRGCVGEVIKEIKRVRRGKGASEQDRTPVDDWSTNVLVVEIEIEKLYTDAQRGITKAETHLCM